MPTNLFQLFRERLKNGMHGSRAVFRRQAAGLLSVVCLLTTTSSVETMKLAAKAGSSQCEAGHHSDASGCRVAFCAIPYPDVKRAGAAGIRAVAQASQFPLADTFKLHSRPTASKVIYLDFNGHSTTGTFWNSGGNTIVTSPYSFDEDASFSDNELAQFQEIWQRVSECFSVHPTNAC